LYRAGSRPKGGCRAAAPKIRNKENLTLVEKIESDVIRDFLLNRNQRFKSTVD